MGPRMTIIWSIIQSSCKSHCCWCSVFFDYWWVVLGNMTSLDALSVLERLHSVEWLRGEKMELKKPGCYQLMSVSNFQVVWHTGCWEKLKPNSFDAVGKSFLVYCFLATSFIYCWQLIFFSLQEYNRLLPCPSHSIPPRVEHLVVPEEGEGPVLDYICKALDLPSLWVFIPCFLYSVNCLLHVNPTGVLNRKFHSLKGLLQILSTLELYIMHWFAHNLRQLLLQSRSEYLRKLQSHRFWEREHLSKGRL